jgi:hypothetical protein
VRRQDETIDFSAPQTMQFLDVPYADKDGAKALGARWNPTRKRWYVPDGVAVEAFEKWLPKGGASTSQGRVDAYAAKIVIGANCIDYTHDCNPFEPCAACEQALAGTGWAAARRRLAELAPKT